MSAPPGIPRILHFTWKTREVPARYRPLVEGWARRHPGWKRRIWTDHDLRAFVERHDPDFLPVFDGYENPIARVDAGRYLVLAHLGGVFVDLDLECFRPIDPLLAGERLVVGLEPDTHGQALKAAERGIARILCPSFLASAPGHAFWAAVRQALVECRHEPDPLDATGPFLLSRVHARYREADPVRLLPPEMLYPVDRDSAWRGLLFDIETWSRTARQAYAHHHWDGTWFRTSDEARIGAPREVDCTIRRPGAPSRQTTLQFGPTPPPAEPDRHLVSCLMVTRERAPMAAVAIECFQRQTWPARELVIVDDDADPALAEHVQRLSDPRIRHIRVPAEDRTLGELRNLSLDAARGQLVCQWDDDDLYDPLRIEFQLRALASTRTDACFLSRWLQWMPAERAVSVSTSRVWEGSMLARRSAVGRYPDLRRGEDTPVTSAILSDLPTVHLDLPRLYLYVGHRRNTHGAAHHRHLLRVATASFTGEHGDSVLRELARRLPIARYEQAMRAVAASRPAPKPPPPARPLERIAEEARQAAAEGRHGDALASWEEVLRHRQDLPTAIGRAQALAELRRIEAAIEQYRDAARRYRTAVDGPLGAGRLLRRLGRTAAAREVLAEALRRDGDHIASLLELAIVEMEAGRLDEAEALFVRVRDIAPAERQAWMGAAAIAARRYDWPSALARWQAVWERFGEPSAPQEITGALLALDRLDEARAFLETIPPDAWSARERLFTHAFLAKLAHDPAHLLATLTAEQSTVIADEVLRRMLVEALTVNGRPQEAAEIVARGGIGRTPTGQMVALHALVLGGRHRVAERHLQRLSQPPALHATSPRLLPDIAVHIRRSRGPAAVREALAGLEQSSTAARDLRLAAGFERECADSLDALLEARTLPTAPAIRPLAIPARPRDVEADWPFDPLKRAWTAVERIRAGHGAVALDLRTTLRDALSVADRIAGAIRGGTPLSVIRLGDGEGNFLPYADDLAPNRAQDQRAIQRLWWSDRTLDTAAVAHIGGTLADAVRSADIVGIPDQYRLATSLGRVMRPSQTSRGLIAVVEQIAGLTAAPGGQPLVGPDQMVTSCHLHAGLAWWDLWPPLFAHAGEVALVTGRTDLDAALHRRFGLAVRRTHRVPPERKYRRDAAEAARPHYPDGFAEVTRALAVEVRPGEVVLVAAGILGKAYCATVRAAGGIALDIGSAADHWCGHATRTRDEAALYDTPPELAAAYAARPELDALYPALAASAFFQGRG
ncbi:hypothetical protein STAQ_28880 [Allostella sp. ATCC 35155]|nr:hypothetical protein STAQ_28880 [Stella sp. ATCC 35155]